MTVEPSSRDVGLTESARPKIARVRRDLGQAPDEIDRGWPDLPLVRKTDVDQRGGEIRLARHFKRPPIEERALTFDRVEEFFAHGIEGHIQEGIIRIALVEKANADREERQPTGKVSRPVERIDEPEASRRPGSATFFLAVDRIS